MSIFTWIGVSNTSTSWNVASAWFDNTTGATSSVAPAGAIASPPAAPTLGSAASSAPAATYYFKVAYNHGTDTTAASAESTTTLAADYSPIVDSPAAALNATTYSVYGSNSTGTETLQASGIAIGTNWTMPGTALVAGGAAAPTIGTANGDTVNFDASAVGPMTGDNQSAITVVQANIKSSFTQTIGAQGSPLQIGITTLRIGDTVAGQSGIGSGRINLDLGAIQSNVLVVGTAAGSIDPGLEPVRIKGTNAANTIEAMAGTIGLATDGNADVATFATVSISGATIDIGAGSSITTATIKSGSLNTQSAPVTLNQYGGTVTVNGTGEITTANLYGGTTNIANRPASGSTIATLNLYGGVASFNANPLAATIGTLALQNGQINTFSESQLTITATTYVFGPLGQFSVGAQ
ncbi:MAG: hypothetical protein ACP5I8_13265 [Phycisphaerae bacterium]